jgi:hypothetical protein
MDLKSSMLHAETKIGSEELAVWTFKESIREHDIVLSPSANWIAYMFIVERMEDEYDVRLGVFRRQIQNIAQKVNIWLKTDDNGLAEKLENVRAFFACPSCRSTEF